MPVYCYPEVVRVVVALIFGGILSVTSVAAGERPEKADPTRGKLIAFYEVTPPDYIAWMGGVVPAGKLLGFWLDKESYDSLDATAGAFLAIRAPALKKASKPHLTLILCQGEKKTEIFKESLSVAIPDTAALETEEGKRIAPGGILGISLDLNMRDIPIGTGYILSAILLDRDKELQRVEWPFRKVYKKPRSRQCVRVPFSVINNNPEISAVEPVFVGIPLPKGALADTDHARIVEASGAEIPAQFSVSSRWSRGGSVRWLGISLAAQHKAARQRTEFLLEYGDTISRANVADPIRVEKTQEHLRIVTGPMQVAIPRTNGQVIDKVWLDTNGDGAFGGDELMSIAGVTGGPYLVDDTGRRYSALLDSEADVVVEESGPLRVVVRIESWFVADDNKGKKQLCKHITRLRAYRGLSRIDLSFGWLMTARTGEARFADIGFSLSVPEAEKLLLSGDRDRDLFADTAAPNLLRYLLQDKWGHFGIYMNFKEKPFADPKSRSFDRIRMVDEGCKSEGWGALRGKRGGLAMGCEDFWQNYPKEISATQGRLTFHIWPAHGIDANRPVRADELTRFYWLHEAKLLNFRIPSEVTNFPEKSAHTSKYFLHFSRGADAVGIMKTHEIKLVFFSPQKTKEALRGEMRATLQPGVVVVDPQKMVGSGVFGPMSVRNPQRYPKEERLLDRSIRAEDRLEKMDRTYGMFNFGGGYSGYDFREYRFNVYRAWRNMHHGCCRTPWLLYFRSGDPFFFLRGLRNARKVLDLGICHYVRKEPDPSRFDNWKVKTVGGLHDYKGLVPWAAGGRAGDYNSMTDFMLYYTYFTGNAHGREVALKWWQGVRRWRRPGGSARTQAGTLAAAIELYKDTQDRRMLPFIHVEFAGLCKGQHSEFGYFSEWQAYAPWLERYWQYTGREVARKVLLRWADAFAEGYGDISTHWGPKGLGVLAAAALASDSPKYMRHLNWLMYIQRMSPCDDPNSIFDGSNGGDSLLNYLQQQMPYALEAHNLSGRDVGQAEAIIAIHPTRKVGEKGNAIDWWFLDEKDEPVTMLFRAASWDETLHLQILAPDGKVVMERDILCDQNHPHGTPRYRHALRCTLAPDGKRGVYRCSLVSEKARFAVLAPVAAGVKEVYPVKDNKVGVRAGQVAFAVPKNSGIYTFTGNPSKNSPCSFYLLDEKKNVLAQSRVIWAPGVGARAGFTTKVDSTAHHRLHIITGLNNYAGCTISGKSPPKYYAVSLNRLFDPDVEGISK